MTATPSRLSATTLYDGPRLDYGVAFPSSGTWYLWTRFSGDHGGDDSVNLGLGGTSVTHSSGTGVGRINPHWEWTGKIETVNTRVAVSVPSVGTHTVNVWMREDGAAIEKLLLTQDVSYTPWGAGPEIAGSTSGGGGGGATEVEPEHDAAGNVTFDGTYAFGYDAWNRLVIISAATKSGSTVTVGDTLQTAGYDGMGRRVVKAVQNSGGLNATYHYYYEGQSQVELRDGSELVLKQYLWAGLAGGYIDELVEVRVNEDPSDLGEDDCERVYLALQDANYNVQALVTGNAAASAAHNSGGVGAVVERYEYTPYGVRSVYSGDGLSDPYGFSATERSARVVIGSTGQAYGLLEIGHQGLLHDEETGIVYNRARHLHPMLGRFVQRDPNGTRIGLAPSMVVYLPWNPPQGIGYIERTLGSLVLRAGKFPAGHAIELADQVLDPIWQYEDGANLYQFGGSNPTGRRDPLGLWWWDGDWVSHGVGGLLGFHGSEAAGGGWNAYSEASYGYVGTFTGGLFDEDYGYFGYADDVKDWLEDEGIKDPCDESAYDFGKNAGRVSEAALLSVAAIHAARGHEYAFGKNFRVAPWGNRTGHPTGRYPHYHRRYPGPGGGIGRHRPWDPSVPGGGPRY